MDDILLAAKTKERANTILQDDLSCRSVNGVLEEKARGEKGKGHEKWRQDRVLIKSHLL